MLLQFNIITHIFKGLNYIGFRKIQNLCKLHLSYLTSRKNIHFQRDTLPAFISVEPANFCQLACSECAVSQTKHTNKTCIDEHTYKKAIDELKNHLFHVIFYFQGEPLLNKQLPELIHYTHKARIYTSISTNAQLLNAGYARELILSGLDKLIISIDGCTQEVYEQYRIGGSLEKAIQGVKNVVEWKHKLKSTTPLVEIQFVVFKINEHQINEMKLLAKSLKADRLIFKSAQLHGFENGHELLTSIDKYARYKKGINGKYEIKNKLKNRCWRLWSGAVINAKGDVVPCCYDKDSKHAFGNVSAEDFAAVWHNKKACGFRASILQNRKQYEMCRNCTN